MIQNIHTDTCIQRCEEESGPESCPVKAFWSEGKGANDEYSHQGPDKNTKMITAYAAEKIQLRSIPIIRLM